MSNKHTAALSREEVLQTFHNNGLNCAESTMKLLIEYGSVALPIETVKLMSGFGGGIQRGLTCGAVTAAVAAIGSVTGRTDSEEDRSPSAEAVTSFMEQFHERFGAFTCRDLRAEYAANLPNKSDAMYHICADFVGTAYEIATEVIADYSSQNN